MAAFVKLTYEEYAKLLESADLLDALHEAGVDNWDGYSHALAIHQGDPDEEDE